MKTWWGQLCTMGPKYGYFPQASKTILIVKERFEAKAKAIFGKSGVKISTRGERHMGEVVGSERFKDKYVSNKVKNPSQPCLLLLELYPTCRHMYREPCLTQVIYSSH